jgi:hypothetical protein
MGVIATIPLPEDSDLMEAIKLATSLRDEELDDFIDRIKNGALEEDKAVLQAKFDKLLKMNENIKLLEDAIVLVYSKKIK